MDPSQTVATSGDVERFQRLYDAHFDAVAAYLLARADRDAAADALAATFEVAWRRIGDVPAHELPWLLGVARRVLANARRSRARQAALLERMTVAARREQRDDGADAAVAAALATAIAKLTASQQEALLLIAWDGLSEREAALALGCSRSAFAARLHRARARLRAALGEQRAGRDAPAAHSSRFPLARSTEETP